MKKVVFVDNLAKKELSELMLVVQNEFKALIFNLEEEEKLAYPDTKKIDSNLFELRIKAKNIYRGFYAYVQTNHIVILHFFNKKTQKTTLKNLKLAKQRLKYYE